MFRKLFALIIILAIGATVWFAFGLWTGLYSIYSYPPSKEYPSGTTLLVARDEGEPLFNSPQYTPPPKKPEKRGGIGFSSTPRPKRALKDRTVIELPFVKWAYNKSLEPAQPE